MKQTYIAYISLVFAIFFEVTATSSLKLSEQFTRILPTVICVIGYIAAFYCLSITLRSMSVAIAYAIWCAAGIVLISIIGTLFFKQSLDWPAFIGLALIVAGVLVINLFSKSVIH